VFHFRRMYCTAYIFMVTKLEQVDVEVMWWKKMCWLYMTVWGNFANQNYGRGEEGQFNCTVSSQHTAV
jgi:hypothetical protein